MEFDMRIDKYLKVSRLIKRRTVAADACSAGRVSVNGRPAKPGADVSVNDIIEIGFGERKIKVQILSVAEHVSKDGAAELYKVIEG